MHYINVHEVCIDTQAELNTIFLLCSINMESNRFKFLPAIIFLFGLTSMLGFSRATVEGVEGNGRESGLETYIVFVSKPEGTFPQQSQDLDGYYHSFLPDSITNTKSQPHRMVHTYRNVVSGFAVKLTAEEAKAMAGKEGVLSARSQKILALHTTHSPDFLGLQQNSGLWNYPNYGKGVIIGVLDTGITPSHPSFDDEGMPPPPAKWRGKCEFPGTQCNRKLIGARNFVTDDETPKGSPPYDLLGHGTHTASTAAGTFVKGANVFGNAKGTAVGMAPLAHLAMYRVCGNFGCPESDILAAMDAAVEDGVDVLSLSLGGGTAAFSEDAIAVGAFGAIQNGIFVSCSAGNEGPLHGSLSNEAPWILTVGASTIDRNIRTKVILGNGKSFLGQSVFQPQVSLPVVLPLIDAHGNSSRGSRFCGEGSLNGLNVKGKIVLCEVGGGVGRIDKGRAVKNAGGAGMILMNDQLSAYSTIADVHVLAASHVSYADGISIQSYINSTSSPRATIAFQGTVTGLTDAPSVTHFSSRGPSSASPGILKPDIIGPGLSIIAAWPLSVENKTNTKATFDVISGTSMSCPHLSGIAALLKNAHPNWSPAAIKSAMMTTAYTVNRWGRPILDERRLPADILATGAGHINPTKATDPGLVYDINPDDYIPYLCGLGYRDREISYIVQRKIKCSQVSSIPEAQLNYPSFSIVFSNRNLQYSQKYTRTVTNVGPAHSDYTVVVTPPEGVSISVNPGKISFTNVNQKATYSVTFRWTGGNITSNAKGLPQGNLIWVSDNHTVRSPISILFAYSE